AAGAAGDHRGVDRYISRGYLSGRHTRAYCGAGATQFDNDRDPKLLQGANPGRRGGSLWHAIAGHYCPTDRSSENYHWATAVHDDYRQDQSSAAGEAWSVEAYSYLLLPLRGDHNFPAACGPSSSRILCQRLVPVAFTG